MHIPIYITDLEYSLQRKILMRLGATISELKDIPIAMIWIGG
jgi:hypothetical protein